MMKLFDDLYIGIPSNIRIDSCVIGKNWVTVRANGNVGMSKLIGDPLHDGLEFGGKWLRDVAGHLYWHDLTKAAVGVAALNCWYNSPEHIAAMNGWYTTDEFKKSYESLTYDDYSYCEGKRVATVGDCLFFALSGKTADEAFELPFGTKINENVYSRLKKYDIVIISADAITAKSMTAILELIGEDGYVVVDGVSAPASQSFFAFNMPVKRVNGYFRRFGHTMEDTARFNLKDIKPGLYYFSVTPMMDQIDYYHKREGAQNFLNSPYKASQFNNKFTTGWSGKKYNRDEWDPIFKG